MCACLWSTSVLARIPSQSQENVGGVQGQGRLRLTVDEKMCQ